MPGTEELMARLSQLEQGYYGDKEAARQKQFMDTYGSRFSNNHGLGMAILNELDARGIDTSAADEAVQQILDTLRTDCQGILDALNNVQEAAIENAKKVEQIADVVGEAVAANPDAAAPDAIPPEVEPAEVPPTLEAASPDAEFNPDEVQEEQSAEPSAETPDEAQAEQSAEQPANPEENPEETVSDTRTKRIQKMKARWGKTDTQKRKDKEKDKNKNKDDSSCVSDEHLKNVFKPAAFMINAAQRGF